MPEITDQILERLAQEEGFHSKGKDFAGIPTVGFGHKLTSEERKRGTVKIGKDFISVKELTQNEELGKLLLRQDAEQVGKKLTEQFGEDKLSPNKFESLVSLSFNIGDVTKAAPKLTKAIREDRDEEAAKQFLDINKIRNQKTLKLEPNEILTNRRKREAEKFLTPEASIEPLGFDPGAELQRLDQEPQVEIASPVSLNLPQLPLEQAPLLAQTDLNTLSDAQLEVLSGQRDLNSLEDTELEQIANLPQDAPQQPQIPTPNLTPISAPEEVSDSQPSLISRILEDVSETDFSQALSSGAKQLAFDVKTSSPLALINQMINPDSTFFDRPERVTDTVTGQVLERGVEEIPAVISGGQAGALVTKKARQLGLRKLATALGGTAAGAVEGTAAIAARTTPEEIPTIGAAAAEIGVTTLAGGILGFIADGVRAVRRSKKLKAAKTKRLTKRLEKAAEVTEIVPQEQARQARKFAVQLEQLDNKINKKLKISRDLRKFDQLGSKQGLKNTEEALRLVGQREELLKKADASINGWGELLEAKERLGKVTTTVNGKSVPAWRASLTQRNVRVPSAQIEELMRTPDVSAFLAGSFSPVDMLRIAQQVDGSIRGPIRRMIVEPALRAQDKFNRALVRTQNELAAKVQSFGIKGDSVTQARLFRLAEGRANGADNIATTATERQFVNEGAKFYSDTIDTLNQVNALFGLPQVKKRANYVTHLREINFMESLGFKGSDLTEIEKLPSKAQKRIKTRFQFERKRGKGAFQENYLQALEAYIAPSQRRIHLTRAASEIQARAQFLPPNLRKAVESWVDSTMLGGIDSKDLGVIANGLDPVLRFAEGFSKALTRGVISGNLSVISQQPSQILGTAVIAGWGPMIKGLGKAMMPVIDPLVKRSSFLSGRTVRDELIPLTSRSLRKFDTFLSTGLEFADKYVARASWYAGLDRARQLGLSPEASIKLADDVGRMLHASYQDVLKPSLIRGRTGKALLPFQTFVFNLFNHITRDPRILKEINTTSGRTELMKMLGAMLATNQMYTIAGLREPFAIQTPAEFSIPGGLEAAKQTAGLIPVAGKLFSDTQGRIPSPPLEFARTGAGETFNDIMTTVFTDDEERREKSAISLTKSVAKFVPAGQQIANTIRGISAARDGYYKVGREEVDIDGLDKIVSGLLGPSATRAVREERERQSIEKIRRKFGLEE